MIKTILALSLLLGTLPLLADTLPPSVVKLKGDTGPNITSTTVGPKTGADVNIISGVGLTDAQLRASNVPVISAPAQNGSGSGAAATVSTVSTITAPANAVGFILMNLDISTTNMRWAVGRTAAVDLGQQLQPGRDTGFVPVGADISIIAESGTVTYDIQWVIK